MINPRVDTENVKYIKARSERIWTKRIPYSLLVGMQTDTTRTEICLEAS